MPDVHETNKRQPDLPAENRREGAVPYAELHCKTNFSFLEGASHPDELVVRAAELGYQALAITDAHSVAGVVRAHGAAKQIGLKLLIGAEIRPDRCSGGCALGDRPRVVRAALAADHRRPPPRRKRGLPARR